MEINLRPTIKQFQALEYLRNTETSFIVFGGGGGGGKSFIGCEWLMMQSIAFPNTRWFIGRKQLSNLMASTYLTWVKVCKHHNFEDWTLNGQQHYIQLGNGSRIDLVDLKYNPSDPLYEDLGSYEFTGGFIEEAGEIDFKAFDVLKTRVGRHLNKEYNLPAKIFITCNPKKNWLYELIYKPWKNGTLPKEFAFIQSLYKDNPYTASDYEKMLSAISDKVLKERLMFGNWEYDDDSVSLMKYDNILDIFTNTVETKITTPKYIVADVARYGSDRTVISIWKGLLCEKLVIKEKQGVDVTANDIKELAKEHFVPYSNILIDDDGIGGGITDILRGTKGFNANSSAIEVNISQIQYQQGNGIMKFIKENYRNLKTQCSYKLAEYINNHKIAIRLEGKDRELLVAELEQIKRKDPDKEGRLEIEPKDKVKEILGRSPDIADCFIAGTLIKTPMGDIAIEKLKVGDEVITPFGITTIGKTIKRKTDTLYELNGEIIGSGNHKFFTTEGLKRLDLHSHQVYNYKYNSINLILWKLYKKLYLKGTNTGFRQIMEQENITTTGRKVRYIGMFGKMALVVKYLKDLTYITLTETATIMNIAILNLLRLVITKKSIGITEQKKKLFAQNAVKNTSVIFQTKKVKDSALINAFNNITTIIKLITKIEFVPTVANPFLLGKVKKQKLAQSLVRHTFGQPIDVYTLTLNNHNAYFANNYLVENCLMMRMWFEIHPAEEFTGEDMVNIFRARENNTRNQAR